MFPTQTAQQFTTADVARGIDTSLDVRVDDSGYASQAFTFLLGDVEVLRMYDVTLFGTTHVHVRQDVGSWSDWKEVARLDQRFLSPEAAIAVVSAILADVRSTVEV